MPITSEDRINDYNKKYGEYLIDKVGDYKCNRCKKIYYPTTDDINVRAMHTYYKCCKICRLYIYNRIKR